MSENELNHLDKKVRASVVSTLAFFDLFDLPLTALEVWQGLDRACSFSSLQDFLDQESDQISRQQGFYFLSGRDKLVEKRIRNYNLYNHKIQKALAAARIMSFLPGLEMVAACNNFSYSKDSDIDVFIITQKNRLWLTRLLVSLAMQFAHMRRHGEKIEDRICLSFYISEDNLDLSSLALRKQEEIFDPYFIHWINDLLPIYGEDMFAKFWQANSWSKDFLPNTKMPSLSPSFLIRDNVFSKMTKTFLNFFIKIVPFNFLNEIAKKIQVKKMSKNKKSAARAKDSRVVISDTILKFHEQDRRAKYREQWQETINKRLQA